MLCVGPRTCHFPLTFVGRGRRLVFFLYVPFTFLERPTRRCSVDRCGPKGPWSALSPHPRSLAVCASSTHPSARAQPEPPARPRRSFSHMTPRVGRRGGRARSRAAVTARRACKAARVTGSFRGVAARIPTLASNDKFQAGRHHPKMGVFERVNRFLFDRRWRCSSRREHRAPRSR